MYSRFFNRNQGTIIFSIRNVDNLFFLRGLPRRPSDNHCSKLKFLGMEVDLFFIIFFYLFYFFSIFFCFNHLNPKKRTKQTFVSFLISLKFITFIHLLNFHTFEFCIIHNGQELEEE